MLLHNLYHFHNNSTIGEINYEQFTTSVIGNTSIDKYEYKENANDFKINKDNNDKDFKYKIKKI